MKSGLQKHFENEMRQSRQAEGRGDLRAAWRSLERAHILSQAYAWPHLHVHGAMFAFARRHHDVRELLGQIPRLVFAAPASWSGLAPRGNTGGADVGIFQPMPIPEDLQAVLGGE